MHHYKNIVLPFIFTIIFVILGLEISVRLLHLAPPLPPFYQKYIKDPILPFIAPPHSTYRNDPWPGGHEFSFEFKTNTVGFRDSERDFTKPPGVFRILALGDSFTMGAGARYEGTYPYQLQEFLNQRLQGKPRVEVINAGQCRYWPDPERILLETIGVKFNPDIVMVGFNNSDISDSREGIDCIYVRQGYLITREAYELGDTAIWLYVHSHLFRIGARWYLDMKLGGIKHAGVLDLENDWQRIEVEYEKMVKCSQGIKARFIVVYIPLKQQLNSTDADSYSLRRLLAWGKRNNVMVIDTTPLMRERAKYEQVYWNEDVHCTEAGYRSIAETICEKLFGEISVSQRE